MIVCIGNPVYDVIRTPYTSTDGRVLSGCSTNASLALSKLGERAVLVGRIGEDFRDRFLADMKAYGIECHMAVSQHTGGFSLVYKEGEDRTLDVLGIADPITGVPGDCLAEARVVLFGPILGETDLELVERVRQKTRALLFLDPQGLLRRLDGSRVVYYQNPELPRMMPYFDVVKANEHEAEVMTGVNPRQDALKAVTKLHAYGCSIAIVTLAEAGSVLYDGRRFFRIPAYSTRAKDPTGAGDVYAGSFIYRYLRNGHDLFETACFASGAASIMVEHSGPDFPLTFSQAEYRMRSCLAGGV